MPRHPSTQDRTMRGSLRYYQRHGTQYPSVTTMLQVLQKQALIPWAAKIERELCRTTLADCLAAAPDDRGLLAAWEESLGKTYAHARIKRATGDRGTDIHALIEWVIRHDLGETVGPMPPVTEQMAAALAAWEDWRQGLHLVPVEAETVVISDEHRFAGTVDLVAEVNGRLALIDWKSGKAIYPEHHLQLVAYGMAYREMTQKSVDLFCLRLPQSAGARHESVQVLNGKELEPIVIAVRAVFEWWQGHAR